MAWQEIHDDGDLRKYRTELPNMADDELGPYEYRLYGHYKRVCGAAGGMCFETVETTATTCRMSAGAVVNARNSLEANGWITVTHVKRHGKRPRPTIRIIDRWLENFQRFAPEPHALANSGEGVDKPPALAVHQVNMDLDGGSAVHLVNNAPLDIHQVNNGAERCSPGEHSKKERIRTKKERIDGEEPNDRRAARAREASKVVDKTGEVAENGPDAVAAPARSEPPVGAYAGSPSPNPLPHVDALDSAVAQINQELLEHPAWEPLGDHDARALAALARQRAASPGELLRLWAEICATAAHPPGWLIDRVIALGEWRGPEARPRGPARPWSERQPNTLASSPAAARLRAEAQAALAQGWGDE